VRTASVLLMNYYFKHKKPGSADPGNFVVVKT